MLHITVHVNYLGCLISHLKVFVSDGGWPLDSLTLLRVVVLSRLIC